MQASAELNARQPQPLIVHQVLGVIMKSCNECFLTKSLSEYPVKSNSKDGHTGKCLVCTRAYYRNYKKENKDAVLKSKKQHYEKNKSTWDAYRTKNATEIAKRKRAWYASKVESDGSFVLYEKIRKMVYRTLEYTGEEKQNRTKQILGYNHIDLKKRIESQFSDGMSWDNYGNWHIDHIKPLAAFDLTDPVQVAKAFHYKNLRPLHWRQNISKGAKAY